MQATVAMLGETQHIPYAFGLGQGIDPSGGFLSYNPSSPGLEYNEAEKLASRQTGDPTTKTSIVDNTLKFLNIAKEFGVEYLKTKASKGQSDAQIKGYQNALLIAQGQSGAPSVPAKGGNILADNMNYIIGGVAVLAVAGVVFAVAKKRKRRR